MESDEIVELGSSSLNPLSETLDLFAERLNDRFLRYRPDFSANENFFTPRFTSSSVM